MSAFSKLELDEKFSNSTFLEELYYLSSTRASSST